MRLATNQEVADWDQLIACNPDGGQAFQLKAWGESKAQFGWKPQYFAYDMPDGRVVYSQWLRRAVPLGRSIWSCKRGPGVITQSDLVEVITQTKEYGLDGIFCRIESEVLEDASEVSALSALGVRLSNRDHSTKATILIDLSPGEDGVLASFRQSARRGIRTAQSKGVICEQVAGTPENLERMFDLMRETEKRGKFGLRTKEYFFEYWSRYLKNKQGMLMFASHDGEVLAGIFVTLCGKRAWYKDGGSYDTKRELSASFLLQWEVMRWLISHGYTSYDMLGVPSRHVAGKGVDSQDGLYEFKRKFNPEITEYIGAWEIIRSPFWYQVWKKAGERIAARLAMRSPEKFLY